MKHRIISLALALLALLMLTLPAAAADTGYTGVINPETGEPYDEDAPESYGDRTALTKNMYYDWSSHDYVYPVSGSLGEVHVNAADGMVLTTPVYVRASAEASVVVYLNGSEYTGSLNSCSTAGEYVVSALVGGQQKRLMSFTLLGKTSNLMHNFVVPDGFYVLEATRNGESAYEDRYSVDMEPEGAYTIEYECSSTNLVYKLETTVDRTPPGLIFKGKLDKQGRVRSKLEFSGLEEGDRIYLERTGEAVVPELNGDGTGTIYDPGNYMMLVMDAAGNTTRYDFIILQYFNLQSWMFFLAVVLVIAAVTAYIVLQRKRLKIG
jgi:hypothetical protein